MRPFPHESFVENAILRYLEADGWERVAARGKSTTDIIVAKRSLQLFVEVKGDVGPSVANPIGQRLKYVYTGLGQLLLNVWPHSLSQNCILFGLGFPTIQYESGNSYFADALEARLPLWLKSHLNLYLFFVDSSGLVEVDETGCAGLG